MHLPLKIRRITITAERGRDWKKYLINQFSISEASEIELDFFDLLLTCKDIIFINKSEKDFNLRVVFIRSTNAKTLVSACSFGYKTELIKQSPINNHDQNKKDLKRKEKCNNKTFFHQGTLHSGEHLESDSDLFLIGDVNPGAMVSASGDVIIWGRLLGTAHAGKNGNMNARISALQLRPVQLRIADKIARGPVEKPQEGFAEQAEIKSGVIVILPAKTF